MITQENGMKLLVVAGVYISVALIVTAGFVLHSNNVMASTASTQNHDSVVTEQQASLEQRYDRIGYLAVRVIDSEVATALAEEAAALADQYLSEEIDDPALQEWMRGAIKQHGLPHIKAALADLPNMERHVATMLKTL